MIAEVVGLGAVSSVLFSFFKEQKIVEMARDSIPIRIHVNGIRGKTSVTRMIGSVLRPKFCTVTKTTGSEPKIIFPDGSDELIIRKGSANIKEQMNVLQIAYENNAECIVFECMAIESSLQRLLEEKVMKSTIGVITNVRYDHEDVMGESLEDIARSLGNTVPYNAHLVITKDVEYAHILESIARERNTIVHYADTENVPKGYSQRFDFMNFDENVALTLEVAKILGIDRDDALRDMLTTKHDIGKGALYSRIISDSDSGNDNDRYRYNDRYKTIHFLNSFANNDVQSLLKMLAQIEYKKRSKKIGLLSHREDRTRRTLSVIKFICEYGFDGIIISSNNKLVENELRQSGFKGEIVTISTNFIEELIKLSDMKDNYWIGLANIKTPLAENVLSYFGVM